VFSACRCDGRRDQRGSAALVTIAQQPGRAQITDIKPQAQACRTPAGRLPDELDPGSHGVGTHWDRGFMAFQLVLAPELVVL
jgi:hypothetical protein